MSRRKRRVTMKCPQCETDMHSHMKCGKCGFTVTDSRKELEVEYKDFKTSELLEIRQKRLVVPSGAEIFSEPSDREAIKREIPAKPSLEEKKSPFPVLAVVGLILALIIGGFFLIRFLILQ